jgi:hypothetical protein
MDMRVKAKLLIPGMQHAEEADFRAEVSRITCNFKKVSALARNKRS